MKEVYKNKIEFIREVIHPTDKVLDIGFWGQGVQVASASWPHKLIKELSGSLYGLDLEFDESALSPKSNYFKQSAETFSIAEKFDVIFCGDVIEHLSNPGLFLERALEHIKQGGGRLVITTPNTFNLFNLTEKLSKVEPTVNKDHTCYFNKKTINVLLARNGWQIKDFGYIYSLDIAYKESMKKKFLNGIYFLLSLFTSKYLETFYVVAVPIAEVTKSAEVLTQSQS